MTTGPARGDLRRFLDGRDGAGPLARFVGPQPAAGPGERCELCGVAVPPEHRHLVDLRRRSLLCSCRACGLLFSEPGAARGRYLVVPERYAEVTPFALTPMQWQALQIPVGMAFFLRVSDPERTVAFYPSPGGATESELVLDAWEEVVAANPVLADVATDTEAALVRVRTAGPAGGPNPPPPPDPAGGPNPPPPPGPECYIVPVDRCYELVGRLRTSWRGFDGGPEVAEHVAAFFADVGGRSRPVAGTGVRR